MGGENRVERVAEAVWLLMVGRPWVQMMTMSEFVEPIHGRMCTMIGDGEDVPRVDHRCIYDPRVPDHVLTLPPLRGVYRKFVRAAAVVRNQEEKAMGDEQKVEEMATPSRSTGRSAHCWMVSACLVIA